MTQNLVGNRVGSIPTGGTKIPIVFAIGIFLSIFPYIIGNGIIILFFYYLIPNTGWLLSLANISSAALM